MKKRRAAGWMIERCRFCLRERAFAEEWLRLQRRDAFGESFVQKLFTRSTFFVMPWKWLRARAVITARDEFIVATVIQWLGTNIGMDFLESTLKKIGIQFVYTAEHQELLRAYYNPWSEKQDSSAFFNFATEQRMYLGEQRPSKLNVRSRPSPRTCNAKPKHIIKSIRVDDPHYFQSFRICIRCGYNPDERRSYLDRDSTPTCDPTKYVETKEKIKSKVTEIRSERAMQIMPTMSKSGVNRS